MIIELLKMAWLEKLDILVLLPSVAKVVHNSQLIGNKQADVYENSC